MNKNIVLCSDGTGNSGGKGRGTNVWKIYRAVDIRDKDHPQTVFYDDGVGSGSFRLFRILFGATGYGLSQNIRELYAYLVANYDEGDQIFLFGFSRGAFTVRSLAGLICRCGVIDRNSYQGPKLRSLIKKAWSIYREAHGKEVSEEAQTFRREYALKHQSREDGYEDPFDVPIRFVGVWDTVDAIGLPIDELRDALNKIYRVEFHDFSLNPCVRNGFHALAIDDERQTFHPVMWDETKKSSGQKIEQVWFAGVHSNVGGGYAKDQMAMVTLDWMMGKARKCGLRFNEHLAEEFHAEAKVHGMLHDSRAGLGAYYRYRPRDIANLSEGKLSKGDLPKIHWTVLERIRNATAGYSPVAIPESYTPVGADPETLSRYREGNPGGRAAIMEHAWDIIWWRRGLYFALVGLTLAVVLTGLILPDKNPQECSSKSGWFDSLFDVLVWATPSSFERWIAGFRSHQWWFFGVLVVIGAFLGIRSRVKMHSSDVCFAGWRVGFGASNPIRENRFRRLARKVRNSRPAAWAEGTLKRLLPWVTIVISALLLIASALAFVFTIGFLPNGPPVLECGYPEANATKLAPGQSVSFDFSTNCPSFATTVLLEANAKFRFTVSELSDWTDDQHPGSPDGLSPEIAELPVLRANKALRRSRAHVWFALLGETRCGERQRFLIGSGPTEIKSSESGRLYLFVNDAVCYWCIRQKWRFYGNNEGTAKVVITKVETGAEASP